MASKVRMDLSIPVSEATFKARTRLMNSDSRRSFNSLSMYMAAMAGDPYVGSMHVVTGAVAAQGKLTVSTGGSSNDETMTLGNVTLTAKTSGAVPADGEFDISATATTQAANMVLAINSVPELQGVVTASNALGVITITAVAPGAIGNGIEMSESLTNVAITNAMGSLTLGVDGTTYDFANGY